MKKRTGIVMILVVVTLLAAVACGGSSTSPLPTQPPPTESPVKGSPPGMVETRAPIEDSAIAPPETAGGDYVLKITSGLPSGCAQFNGYKVERDYNRFVVEVTNLMPGPNERVACTMVYGYHEGEAVLGSGLVAGGPYSVEINGVFTHIFIAENADGMVEKESPIDEVEVTDTVIGFMLTVNYRLPKGKPCSRFNDVTVNRRPAGRIEVTVTHMEVTEDYGGDCTGALPSWNIDIPLGSDFVEGQTYTVSVNGKETAFTAR